MGLAKGLAALVLMVTTTGYTGNERGGGTAPAPVFMPQDAVYECEIKLTQLSKELHTPLVSRAQQTFSWKKGDYAGRKGEELNKIADWKHYRLKQVGPFLPTEIEVKDVPKGAAFEGFISVSSERPAPSLPADIEPGFGMIFTSSLSWANTGAKTRTIIQSSDRQVLETRKQLKAVVRKTEAGSLGEIVDQRNLEVICRLAD